MYKIRPTDRPGGNMARSHRSGRAASGRSAAAPGRRALLYDVLLHDLTDMQRARLAAFVARTQREPYIDILGLPAALFAVPAVGCELLEAGETAVSPGWSIMSRGRVKMARLIVAKDGRLLGVHVPYNQDFIKAAKSAGYVWTGKRFGDYWRYDERNLLDGT